MGQELVKAVFEDPRSAPIDERLRAMLVFLEKMTLTPEALSADDGALLQRAGISRAAAEDAILIGYSFNLIDRLADTFSFQVMSPQALATIVPGFLLRPY